MGFSSPENKHRQIAAVKIAGQPGAQSPTAPGNWQTTTNAPPWRVYHSITGRGLNRNKTGKNRALQNFWRASTCFGGGREKRILQNIILKKIEM